MGQVVVVDEVFARSLARGSEVCTGQWKFRVLEEIDDGVYPVVDNYGRRYIALVHGNVVVLCRSTGIGGGDPRTYAGVALEETAKVTVKRILYIPKSIAEKLGLREGDKLKVVEAKPGLLVLEPSSQGELEVRRARTSLWIQLPQGTFADENVSVRLEDHKIIVARCDYHIVAASRIGGSLQVKIPSDLVKQLGWQDVKKLKVYTRYGKIIMEPVVEE